MLFQKILIANRGEIACRVIRTARRMGIATVAVYSEADADAQHVRLADEAWPIGGPRPQDSYLRGDVILDVAKQSGAQAIHPGYGFLSENADFADAVEAAGIAFIGPKAASMRRMGSKAGAKELMHAAGVPVVPGYTGEDQSPELLQREADRIGYPLMIKAAHGGGGKGMRVVRAAAEFLPALESCQREARNAFGRDRVLLERYIESPRHIEIQVFGDAHGNAIHLNERECSAQRRYQKVLEESPSPFLTPELRARMGAAAVLAARAIDYANAGTVEFIVAPSGEFFFMEINTRLQVEHPVTEMVTGLDLVEWQLRVAAGEPLPLAQDAIPRNGHAIEVRLYAEDPDAGFLPGSGRLQRLRLPAPSAHVRVDAGVVEGDVVTIFYDPMIAKLIVHDRDRAGALARLRDALADCAIDGPKSNIAFLERLVRHPAVVDGSIDTGYLDRHLDEFIGDDAGAAAGDHDAALLAAATAALLAEEAEARCAAAGSSDPGSPWAIADGWRLGHAGLRRVVLRADGQRHVFEAHGAHGDYRISRDGAHSAVAGARLVDGGLSARFDGAGRRYRLDAHAGRLMLHDGRRHWRFERALPYQADLADTAGSGDRIAAPMPGRIVVTRVAPGDSVAQGQELLVMEAMKMELALKAPRDGVVAELRAHEGDFVEADAVLVVLES
ncbi:acetyl/propionyl/methylcrotonyl-CoA carboxylase subunit alpha [Luteimonas sp. MC1828]|uniref:acetyl/propionyl/methylcrotonyl-CoA carboxylase subunit alpha n=1 Tax=Luteimonas sp. MC1828 TaxID=2799787 RepID=UPI0018F1EDAB|nr:acetyl/propionyl/methylcrotonyl-CoA carboxylase subunit alpha [Luteimonas sp. MC1828]MBJ7573790.1 acetyl/propionyl/methylcrotonyl-CoA carboxylase subunit alpha [Luteimonas sp. MC1828]